MFLRFTLYALHLCGSVLFDFCEEFDDQAILVLFQQLLATGFMARAFTSLFRNVIRNVSSCSAHRSPSPYNQSIIAQPLRAARTR
jgi:hypothetical protein